MQLGAVTRQRQQTRRVTDAGDVNPDVVDADSVASWHKAHVLDDPNPDPYSKEPPRQQLKIKAERAAAKDDPKVLEAAVVARVRVDQLVRPIAHGKEAK